MKNFAEEVMAKLKIEAFECENEFRARARLFSRANKIPYYSLIEDEKLLQKFINSECRALAERYDINPFEINETLIVAADLYIFLHRERLEDSLRQLRNIYKLCGGVYE